MYTGSKGDRVNIDWGYLYLSATEDSPVWAGSLSTARMAFVSTGASPTQPDARTPRACGDDLPGLSTVFSLAGDGSTHTIVWGYDDVQSVNYFKSNFAGLWTKFYENGLPEALAAAEQEHDEMLDKSLRNDEAVLTRVRNSVIAVGGSQVMAGKYAQLCSLSYRQTLAATKLVWNHELNTSWNFLKEISTNGDMSTMDVIYPASPFFLFTDPELLRQLLVPVLEYAFNSTYIHFDDLYSPHQLGTYPIGDASTASQEPMPLENSGNMIFMLLGLVQRTSDASWLLKYWPMLVTWVDEIASTAQFPASQICKD